MKIKNEDFLVLRNLDMQYLLKGNEQEVINAVTSAYLSLGNGEYTAPHSTFLRFSETSPNRIIALPAFLKGDLPSNDVAGIKWIASFPENISNGIDRASAVMVLNSVSTGIPEAFLEASLVSGWRTAASAAIAAKQIHFSKDPTAAALIGCGYINFEIVRFLRIVFPKICRLYVYDISQKNASRFREHISTEFSINSVEIVEDIKDLFEAAQLISIATTASAPYLTDPRMFKKGSTVLHISLRDLSSEVILKSDNIVDDLDHVCRANTSIHITAQSTGHTDFVRCSIADILNGSARSRCNLEDTVIFSPFGLGILDLAVAQFVYKKARENNIGYRIPEFLPLRKS